MEINFTPKVKKQLKKLGLVTIQQGKKHLDDFELEMPCGLFYRVGDKIKMGAFSYILSERWQYNVIIGRYCSIAENVKLNLDRHPPDWLSTSPFQYTEDYTSFLGGSAGLEFIISRPTVIGNDVWIGDSVLIKEGITIGDGAIVGCGALVTKDVPPYAIVVGTPARVLRYRFAPDIIERLLELKWWEYDYRNLLHVSGDAACTGLRSDPRTTGHIDFDKVESAINQISSFVKSGLIQKYQGRILTTQDLTRYASLWDRITNVSTIQQLKKAVAGGKSM